MLRRNYLALIGPLLAVGSTGCVSTITANNDSPREPTPKGDTLVTFEATNILSFSQDHPGRVRLTITNTSDHQLKLIGGPTPPFSTYASTDEALYVIPKEANENNVGSVNTSRDLVPNHPIDGCWQLADEPFINAIAQMHTLDPSEQVTRQYSILGAPNTACLSAGTYQFTNTLSTQIPDKSITATSKHWEITLMLEVTINKQTEIRDISTSTAVKRSN
ncbi:MAG: hypothetical protein ABEI06_08550 [Halobacteriaceae archaeon]